LKFILKYHDANYSRYLSGEGLKEVISEINKLGETKGNGPSPVPLE
jgi:hypothetical protein